MKDKFNLDRRDFDHPDRVEARRKAIALVREAIEGLSLPVADLVIAQALEELDHEE
jgi:hypothetical protein